MFLPTTGLLNYTVHAAHTHTHARARAQAHMHARVLTVQQIVRLGKRYALKCVVDKSGRALPEYRENFMYEGGGGEQYTHAHTHAHTDTAGVARIVYKA